MIVLSDSHGDESRMEEVIKKSRADVVVHLGDGNSQIEHIAFSDCSTRLYYTVSGNCDRFCQGVPCERIFELEGVRFLALHGDRFNVKGGLEALTAYARSKDIDVVLYGHTHRASDEYLPPEKEGDRPLRLLNPGSIGDHFRPSFASVTVKNGEVLTNICSYERGK